MQLTEWRIFPPVLLELERIQIVFLQQGLEISTELACHAGQRIHPRRVPQHIPAKLRY